MNSESTSPYRIAIVGAGVSGLAAATELIQQSAKLPSGIEVTIFDSRPDVGGLLRTSRLKTSHGEDYLIESSADMFTTKLPYALQLCQRIGYTDQLIPTNEKKRGAWLATDKGLQAIPQGFSLLVPKQIKPILKSPLLSWGAKLRLLLEPVHLVFRRRFKSDGSGEDESLESFAVRHWGREVFDKVIQPLVAGIYTADPARLSMKAALAEFVELERRHGRLLKVKDQAAPTTIQKSNEADGDFQDALSAGGKSTSNVGEAAKEAPATGARYGLFLCPRQGMQHWMESARDWLVERDVNFQMSQAVTGIKQVQESGDERLKTRKRWELNFDSQTSQEFDAVIVSTPVQAASKLLKDVSRPLAETLSQIHSASAAIVVGMIRRDQLPEKGVNLKFGVVVPECLGRPMIACSFASNKFPGRSTDDKILIRCFFGGALHPEYFQLSDADLQELARKELVDLLKAPELQIDDAKVVRWDCAMPQYELGHLQRVDQIEEWVAGISGIAIAGNAFRGVGIPQCIKSGFDAATKVIADIADVESLA